jgi:3-deoxy-D-manno-octulosonic-acid transferase
LYRALIAGLVPIAIPALTIRDCLTGKKRPSFRLRISPQLDPIPPGGLWLHAVSVGEVEIARRLVRDLTVAEPDLPLVVTATTATGLDLARRSLTEGAVVAACPLDLPSPLKAFLQAARPRALAIVETELWPEMLHQTARRGIASVIVNARLSDASFRRYRRVRPLLVPLLEPLGMVLARSQSDAERFAALGVPSAAIRVTGNIKYDLEPDTKRLPWAQALQVAAGERPVVVAGSTMEGEEAVFLDVAARCAADGRAFLLLLAPRHPERFDDVAELVTRRGLRMTRRSAGDEPTSETEIYLLDTIGELARAYRLATVAFIGGSLVPTGGHNPLEPAVWGVPVLSGPLVHNFVEVYDEMTAAGAAVLVDDIDDLTERLRGWLDNPRAAGVAGAAGRVVVESNRGAAERTVSALLEVLSGTPL